MPVLGLHKEVLKRFVEECMEVVIEDLDEADIGSIVEQVPHDVAEEDHLAGAVGEAEHTLNRRESIERRTEGFAWCWAPKVIRFFMGGLGHLTFGVVGQE
jgi:hypothetical protein